MTNDTQRSPERPQPQIALGESGQGVYVSDVVRWLMKKHHGTRAQVVNAYLCPAMLDTGPVLYLVHPGGDATAIGDREWFRSGSGNKEMQRADGWRILSRGIDYPREVEPTTPSLGPGIAGAAAWLVTVWGHVGNSDAVTLDAVGSVASHLAVSEADARRCWGWGEEVESVVAPPMFVSPFPLANWTALMVYRTENPGVDWALGNQIDVALQELERRIRSGKTKSAALNEMGRELGMKGEEPRKPLLASLERDRKRNRKSVSDPSATQIIKVKNGRKVA